MFRNIRHRQLDILEVFEYVESTRKVDDHISTGTSKADVRRSESTSTTTILRSDRGTSEIEERNRKTRIIALDWSINKPLVTFDGWEVHYYNSIQELLQNLNGETILCEAGIPRKLLDLSKHRVLIVDSRIVKQKRQELGLSKSDENDAKVIYLLYQEQSHLFKELTERDWRIEQLRRKLKVVEKIQKIRKMLQQTIRSLQREYGLTEDELMILRALEKRFIDLEKVEYDDLFELAKRYFPNEIQQLTQIPGISKRVAPKLLCLLWDKKFPSFDHLKSYAGLSPDKGRERYKNHWYSRELRTVMYQVVTTLIMKKNPSYYKRYLLYKERKLKEGFTFGHVESMARRWLAKKVLKEVWKVVRKWGR